MGGKHKRQAQDAPAGAPAAKKQAKEAKKDTNKKETKKSAAAAAKKAAIEAEPLPILPFLDNAKGPELKREVQLYDQLSSEDAGERLAAADAVVSGLLMGEGASESTMQRHLERRLFRGLASGRKGARLGFSIVLTEVLGQMFGKKDKYPGLGFDKVLEILKLKTKPEGDLSGQEEKDHALGLLFGLQSFVRAKILFSGDEKRWEVVFDSLMYLCGKKPWLREEVGWVVVEALAQMSQSQAETTLQRLFEAGLAASPEGVGIWIAARRQFPDMKFPPKPWGSSGNPLEHLKSLGKALKESSSAEAEGQAKQAGSWNPQLHFVWGMIVDQYVAGARSGDEDVADEFEKFWKVAVDENLFSASASRERKFWGFLLFQKMLTDASDYRELLVSVFSPNLVRCLINHMSQEDRFLHRAAEKSLRAVQQMAEAHPHTIPTVLPKLIGGNGFYNFDQVTKTKTIDKMLGWASGKDAEAVVEILLRPALKIEGCESDKDAETRRQCFGDYLLSMIRRVNVTDESVDATWVKTTGLPTLGRLSYSKKHLKCKPELSEASRTMFRGRLTSAFAHLISDPKGFSYPIELLQSVKTDAVEMEDEVEAAKDKALATMEKLLKKTKKASEKEKISLEALALLYALVIFQLLNGESDAASVLDELKLCYDKLIRGKEDEEGQDVSQVLVEILLSLMSRSSLLLRKVAQHVFTAFAGEISAEGLALMTDVLGASESAKGQQALFDQNDDEEHDHDDDEGSDSDELDSDVEMISANGDADDAEDGEDADMAALDKALASALDTHRLDEDAAAESESDADMSDSEMLQLDEKLVEIFAARKKTPNKKQEAKDARATVVNLKNRILDLLEIYVRRAPEKVEAYGIILPLLRCMRETGTKQADGEEEGEEKVDFDILERIELLKEIHEEAAKDASHAFAKAASTASLLVASSLYKVDRRLVKKVAGVYRDTQVQWVMGEKKVAAGLFVDWVNWCQSHAGAAAAQ
ncbi:DNA-directed DNA polymerase [Pseudogymnoascus australis]